MSGGVHELNGPPAVRPMHQTRTISGNSEITSPCSTPTLDAHGETRQEKKQYGIQDVQNTTLQLVIVSF